MVYNKITIASKIDTAEILGGILMSLGIDTWETIDQLPVEDPYTKKQYAELQPDIESQDCDLVKLCIYPEAGVALEPTTGHNPMPGKELGNQQDTSIDTLVDTIKGACEKSGFFEDGWPIIELSTTDEVEWRDKWKEYFHAFLIEDVWITPTWVDETPPKDANTVLTIDPGISFGTGTHESTRLCIKALCNEALKGKTVLDFGCGSGILSVLSLLKGAGSVTGVDIDPDALIASQENMEKNHCDPKKYQLYAGDITKDLALNACISDAGYDIVVANILADIIVDLMPILSQKCKKDGKIIVSGIIDFKKDFVVSSFNNHGFIVIQVSFEGEWCSLIAVRDH